MTGTEAESPDLGGKRIVWVDWARAFAICAVVVCHASESIYSFTASGIGGLALPSEIVAFSFFTLGRLGVPVFLFISGYLLLDRKYDRAACIRFWKTKWIPLFVVSEIWLLIYYVILCVGFDKAFSIESLLKTLLFFQKVGMPHTWYLPMIIGLYLFIPFIANGLKAVDDHSLLVFPLGIMILILFSTPIASAISQGLGQGELKSSIEPGFSGGVYGCYMLLGYCVRKDAFKKIPAPALIATGLVSFMALVAVQICAYSQGHEYNAWYTNALLLLSGLAVFELFSRGSGLKENKAASTVAYYSFAIYLVHYPLKLMLAPYFKQWCASVWLPGEFQVPLFTIVLLILSLIVCRLLAAIPKLGPKLLYLR